MYQKPFGKSENDLGTLPIRHRFQSQLLVKHIPDFSANSSCKVGLANDAPLAIIKRFDIGIKRATKHNWCITYLECQAHYLVDKRNGQDKLESRRWPE